MRQIGKMACYTFRFLQIFMFLTLILKLVNAEETIKDRIQKHRAWLNQRSHDRQLVGYVETKDPYQKIKYFKKLIKFKNKDSNKTENEIFFIPHSKLPSSPGSGEEFSYDIVNSTTDDHNTSLNKNDSETLLQEHVSNEIIKRNENIINETIKKQISDVNTVIDTSTKMNEIEKEPNGNKTDDDVDIHNNSTLQSNGKNPFKNSKKHMNDSFNDVEIQKFINEYVKYNSHSNITIKKIWSKWSSWSECSRTCGDGIKSQSRECTLKMYQDGKKINATIIPLNECIGLYKRYRICNKGKCSKPEEDFRQQQCSSLNDQSFRGKQYEWEPYIKDGAECEMNCKPINQKYFARLKEYVIDGTECKIPSHHSAKHDDFDKAVCIEGKCKVVLKNGMIFGSSVNMGNVRCGNTVCKPVSQIFAKNSLPNGYVHITTIPATASNITILELEDSINLLALKTTDFVINGNYSASPSGKYELGGAEFEYFRIDDKLNESHRMPKRNDGVKEWITSPGPLHEPVHLLMLSQQANTGVKYEYLLPINFAVASEEGFSDSDYSAEENLPLNTKLKAANRHNHEISTKKKRKYAWKVIGFTECNKSCGGGIQHPIIRCTRGEEGNMKIYSRKKCAHLKHPTVSDSLLKCNIQPCPAFWKISDWTSCKCEDSNNQISLKSREVKCVQELISGVVIQVNAGACSEERPLNMMNCECSKQPYVKPSKQDHIKPMQNHSILQQYNTQSDQKVHVSRVSSSRAKPNKSKKAGVWLTSDWSEECLGECGEMGQQFRTIFCDRSMPNLERCDIRLTPNVYKECTNNGPECQQGSWFIGPWSKCSGDCWNSQRSRTVICIKNDGFAEESECDLNMKPSTFEDCKIEDLKDCTAKWHYSDWTECSKSCGNGMQKRTVKCLEVDTNGMTMRESKSCKYSVRPTSMRYCNTHNCSESTTISPRVDMLQNDDPQCRNKLSNCHVVTQKTNLCAYHYYSENCCQSCRSNF